jgi:hypothetical protein
MGALGQTVASGVVAGLGDWLEHTGLIVIGRGILQGVGWLGRRVLDGVAASANANGLNVITQISTPITVDQPDVIALWQLFRGLALAGLSVVLVVAGYAAAVRIGGVTLEETAVILPRVVVAAFLATVSLDALRWLVDGANVLCAGLAGAAGTLLGDVGQQVQSDQAAGALLLVYAIVAALVLVQRLFLHALLAVLVVTAPLAAVCWAYGPWSGWFTRWSGLLAAVVAGSIVQALALRLGSSMLARMVSTQGSSQDAQTWMAGGVGLATLSLALAAPSLVGAGVVHRSLGMGRALALSRMAGGLGFGSGWRRRPEPEPVAPKAAAHEVWPSRGWATQEEDVLDVTFTPLIPKPRAALPSPV